MTSSDRQLASKTLCRLFTGQELHRLATDVDPEFADLLPGATAPLATIVEGLVEALKSRPGWIEDFLKIVRRERPPANRHEALATQLRAIATSSASDLEARYRKVLCEGLDRVPFAGLKDARRAPHVRVHKLFVPLDFRFAEPGTPATPDAKELRQQVVGRLLEEEAVVIGEPTFSTKWLTSVIRSGLDSALGRLSTKRNLSPRPGVPTTTPTRFVILGPPGSGKSLLSRVLTLALAQGSDNETSSNLPLYLPLRELRATETRDTTKPLADILFQRFERYYVTPTRTWFDKLLQEGRAVVILDGLDELGHDATRVAMCQRVRELCAAFEQLKVIVTSRVAGYNVAPLDADAGFETFRIEPLSDSAIRKFCVNWSHVRNLDASRLLSAFRTNERIWGLVRTPLLATIAALVYTTYRELPTNISALYESLVGALLETWPRERDAVFERLSVVEQRELLELLSLLAQDARSDTGSGVLFKRNELTHFFTTALADLRGESRKSLKVTRDVEQWLEYLELATGLLIEETPNKFAFLHLSFIEYLAATRLSRCPPEAAARMIHERFERAPWQPTIALYLETTDREVLDAVFTEFCGPRTRFESLLFLLNLELEQARLCRQQLDQLLHMLAASKPALLVRNQVRRLAERTPDDGLLVRTLVRESLESGDAGAIQRVGAWLPWRGSQLAQLSEDACAKCLSGREDRHKLAPWLLGFGATHPLGRWAMTTTSPDEAIAWSREEAARSGRTLLDHLLTLLAESQPGTEHVAAALVLCFGEQTLRRLAPVVANESLGASVFVRPGTYSLPTWPRSRALSTGPTQSPHLTEFFVGEAWHQASHVEKPPSVLQHARWIQTSGINRRDDNSWFGSADELMWAGDLVNLMYVYDLHGSDWLSVQPESTGVLTHEHAALEFIEAWEDNVEAAEEEAEEEEEEFDYAGPATGPDSYIREELDSVLAKLTLEQRKQPFHFPAPSEAPEERTGPRVLAAFRKRSNDTAFEDFCELASRHVAELMLSMATSPGLDEATRVEYVELRQQARWLLENFDAIELWAAALDTPLMVGVELALAWIQSLTTWSWPATERWRGHFSQDAPEHWFARANWYIARALHEPTNAAHRAEVEAALRDGIEDSTLHPLARQLQRVWSLFDLPL